MPRLDLAFAQKILYGNSEVFVVPSTACYWLVWQEVCRELWSSRAHLQKNQQRQRVSHWNGALYGALSQGTSTLAYVSQGQNLQFCIWMPVLFNPVISAQGKIPSITIAADDIVIDRTVHMEHLLLQSNLKCFVSHSLTYLILSIMNYHIYQQKSRLHPQDVLYRDLKVVWGNRWQLSVCYIKLFVNVRKKIKIELIQSKIPAGLKNILRLYLMDNRSVWQENDCSGPGVLKIKPKW